MKVPATAQKKIEALEQGAADAKALANAAPAGPIKAQRQGQAEAAAQLANNLKVFLQKHDGSSFQMAPAPTVKLSKGESTAQAVERIRSDIQETRKKLHQVRNAPLSKAELKQQAEVFVEQAGKRAAPSLGHDLARGLNIQAVPLDVPASAQPAQMQDSERMLGLMCWCQPDAVLAALHADIDALPGAGIDAESKAERSANLKADLLDFERQEEAIINQSASAGQVIARRSDASPLAVLGIQQVGAATEAA